MAPHHARPVRERVPSGTAIAAATGEPLTARAPEPDPADVVREVLAGKADAFETLIERFRAGVAQIVAGHVPADAVAEVAHDVFVRAYLSLRTFEERAPFEHWLSRIAVRTCYDFWRARRHAPVPLTGLTERHDAWVRKVVEAESNQIFAGQIAAREAKDVLDWALQQLSPEQRMVVTLIHLEGRSIKEASALLGWTEVNVKVRAHRARRQLRQLLAGIMEREDA
jgi:RNA polymerase sigma-70 factor (ECF subfamily)